MKSASKPWRKGIEDIERLADPIGTVLAEWTRPNGMVIQRRRVPLGVIGIIYESRPNVTADAGALCLKSSNAVILRGRLGECAFQCGNSRLSARGFRGRGSAERLHPIRAHDRSCGRRLHAG